MSVCFILADEAVGSNPSSTVKIISPQCSRQMPQLRTMIPFGLWFVACCSPGYENEVRFNPRVLVLCTSLRSTEVTDIKVHVVSTTLAKSDEKIVTRV